MFDLKAGVHFDEIEFPVFIEEFHRAGTAILQLRYRLTDDLAHFGTLFGVERRGRRFLEYLLVAALQRAIALAHMDGAALAIAEHLEFDVARFRQVFLDVDGIVAERRLGLVLRLTHQARQAGGIGNDLHAATAAARCCLDQHRIADVVGDLDCFLGTVHRAIGTRHQRQAERRSGALGLDLVAHLADMFGVGADPDDLVLFNDLGKARVFGKKAIARVDGIGLGDLGRRNDGGDVEIAVGRRWRPDADRFIGQPHVHRIGIGGGMDSDSADAHFAAGTMDTQRDFAAIGDEDLPEHCHAPIRSR